MQLGIFAKTFGRPTLEAMLEAVAGHGLHCVQFNFACAGWPSLPDRIYTALADKIRREMEARKITMAAVSGTFNMIHPNLKIRRDGLRRLAVLASSCPQLNTSVITLCTGTRDLDNMWRHHPANDSPEAWRDLVKSMGEAARIAAQHNVTLGIEPEVNNVVDSARKARRLLDEIKSPRLKIIMDAENLFHPGDLPRMKEILSEAIDLLGGDLVLAHAKELGPDGHADDLALGQGVLDWDSYLALLRQSNFTGPLIMHGFDECDVAASVSFLRSKMETVACRR